MSENLQRALLLALAASPEEMTTTMLRSACGLSSKVDIATRVNNLIVSGAVRRRVTQAGERWFHFNLHWRPARDEEMRLQVEAALARRPKIKATSGPVVDEPITRAAAPARQRTPGRAAPVASVQSPAPVAVDSAPASLEFAGELREARVRHTCEVNPLGDCAACDAEDEAAGRTEPEPVEEAAAPVAKHIVVDAFAEVGVLMGEPEEPEAPLPAAMQVRPVDREQPPIDPPQEVVDRIVRPSGLLDRIEVILTDLEDLVGDACDLRLDHETIKAIVLSQAALQRAARHLPREVA